MRILRVANVADNRMGGMARVMHFTSEQLVASGHEVDFLFNQDLRTRLPARFDRFCVPIRIVQLVFRSIRAGRNYDVVEIHEPSAAAYALARSVISCLPPLIVISYGIESRAEPITIKYAHAKHLPMTWKQRYGYRFTTLWQSNFALRHADHMVVFNTEDRAHLVSNMLVPIDRITVTHSAVSDVFLRCPTGPSPGTGVIFLASWLDRKGIPDLIRILTRAIREVPGLPVTIAGCGVGVDKIITNFPADCRSNIRIVPQIRGDHALLAEYRRHAIFLLPSIFEGQPLSMLEAASAGLALICTNICGMKDFIRNGVNGITAEVGDTARLGDALIQLLADPILTARLSLQAQLDAREYTWMRSADRYLAGVAAAMLRR